MQNKGKFFLYRNAFQTENYENQTLDLQAVYMFLNECMKDGLLYLPFPKSAEAA